MERALRDTSRLDDEEDEQGLGVPNRLGPEFNTKQKRLEKIREPMRQPEERTRQETADPFDSLPQLKPNWPNGDMGWGIVRLHNTLTFDGDPHGLWVVDGATVGTGGEVSFTVVVTDPLQGLKVTLAWVDPAATVGANPSLVKDLDLTVALPDGTDLPGNVFAGIQQGFGLGLADQVRDVLHPVSVPGPADRKNVEEQVVLPVALPGEYTITVTGANVPAGPQAFALVVSGGI